MQINALNLIGIEVFFANFTYHETVLQAATTTLRIQRKQSIKNETIFECINNLEQN